MDTLVFDIETKNFFTDPGIGWDNFDALQISVVGAYSYESGKYFCFEESEMEPLSKLFRRASSLVGFGINRYDVPVLQRYFAPFSLEGDLDLWKKGRVDLLEEIEIAAGQRISLDKLALANLGVGKIGKGADAIGLYREGKIEELKTYCLKDVELTKRLYDIYRREGKFLVPDRRTGDVLSVQFEENGHASLL